MVYNLQPNYGKILISSKQIDQFQTFTDEKNDAIAHTLSVEIPADCAGVVSLLLHLYKSDVENEKIMVFYKYYVKTPKTWRSGIFNHKWWLYEEISNSQFAEI